MEIMGFIFGMAGLTFALSALAKIGKLEKLLKEAGVLKPESTLDE